VYLRVVAAKLTAESAAAWSNCFFLPAAGGLTKSTTAHIRNSFSDRVWRLLLRLSSISVADSDRFGSLFIDKYSKFKLYQPYVRILPAARAIEKSLFPTAWRRLEQWLFCVRRQLMDHIFPVSFAFWAMGTVLYFGILFLFPLVL